MIREGTTVKWKWGNGSATGTVDEVHHEKLTRTIEGTEVTREASAEDPAYVIKQEDGSKVIKGKSEVERADS